MKGALIKIGIWVFLGNYTLKKSLKTENILRVITLNLITLLGSAYLIAFFSIFHSIGMHPLFYAALLSIFAVSFTLVHTEKGMKYFDYVKIAVILGVMPFYGVLYANTSHGYIWTFLLPLAIIFVMELKWGLIFCLAYYAFMVAVELKTGKYGLDLFARYTCVFWAQAALIATYETFRGIIRDRLIRDKKEIEYLSNIDHLTKLYNRRYFSESVEREFEKAINHNENICFLMLDADKFKEYNDTYGHLQGDEMLISIAKVLKSILRRSGDLVFRMGGEEFGILLPNSNYDWAFSFAEKIRLEIEGMKVPLLNVAGETKITVSVGVASVSPKSGDTPETLMKLADNNLYKAKEQGRNRVVG